MSDLILSGRTTELAEAHFDKRLIDGANVAGGRRLEDVMEDVAKEKHNKAIMEYQDQLEHMNKLEKESQSKDMANLEFMPNGSRIVVKQYAKNPYNVLKVESGLITGGANTIFDSLHFNQESGEIQEDDRGIVVGKVIEVGPDCKYVEAGDDIFYIGFSAGVVPFPFFDQGFEIVSEQNIIVIVNEQLKERIKNKIKK